MCDLAAALLTAVFMILMTSLALAQADLKLNPQRNAYFGELHIHSSWSVDAYVFGTCKANFFRPSCMALKGIRQFRPWTVRNVHY
jgi:hypothetical protein